MIECRTCPVRRRVALCAVMAEISCNVVRIRGLLIFRRMALITISIHKLVVAVHMARLAWCGRVSSGQWETRRAVIECRWLPHSRRMASRAIMAEVPRHMVRIGCLLIFRCMTLIAVCVYKLVVAIAVA